MAHYLVTGGCGFIGSHLIDKLIQLNHKVSVLDNLTTGHLENLSKSAELIIGDIRDSKKVTEALSNVDGVFHLAAEIGIEKCRLEWLETHSVNQGGTVTLFDAASHYALHHQKIIPIIYASSCAVYGNTTQIPSKETIIVNPISAYGADKLGCELHGAVATIVHNIPTIGLRLFNVYGPRQDPHSPYSGVISVFIDHMQQGKPIDIFGDGEQMRDFIYVTDVVDHFIYFMNHIDLVNIVPAVINVCTGKMHTINNLINFLETHLNISVKKNYLDKRPGDVYLSGGDPTKAQELGIKAKVSLNEGLKKNAG